MFSLASGWVFANGYTFCDANGNSKLYAIENYKVNYTIICLTH